MLNDDILLLMPVQEKHVIFHTPDLHMTSPFCRIHNVPFPWHFHFLNIVVFWTVLCSFGDVLIPCSKYIFHPDNPYCLTRTDKTYLAIIGPQFERLQVVPSLLYNVTREQKPWMTWFPVFIFCSKFKTLGKLETLLCYLIIYINITELHVLVRLTNCRKKTWRWKSTNCDVQTIFFCLCANKDCIF